MGRKQFKAESLFRQSWKFQANVSPELNILSKIQQHTPFY